MQQLHVFTLQNCWEFVCVLVAVVGSAAQRFSPGEPLASTMPMARVGDSAT